MTQTFPAATGQLETGLCRADSNRKSYDKTCGVGAPAATDGIGVSWTGWAAVTLALGLRFVVAVQSYRPKSLTYIFGPESGPYIGWLLHHTT